VSVYSLAMAGQRPAAVTKKCINISGGIVLLGTQRRSYPGRSNKALLFDRKGATTCVPQSGEDISVRLLT
jgi:hypothetical protein